MRLFCLLACLLNLKMGEEKGVEMRGDLPGGWKGEGGGGVYIRTEPAQSGQVDQITPEVQQDSAVVDWARRAIVSKELRCWVW